MDAQIIIQGVFVLGLIFVIYNIPYIVEKIDSLKNKRHSHS
ncbi:hypothetical protein SPONN_2262 [uncultured Candidatus Thioglobus sp.]|nr:hypothetical protein SPONN_2262 [uncultured Candidatus Thioglobus sp.]